MAPIIETQQNQGKTEVSSPYREQHEEQSAKEQTKEAQREALRRAPESVKSAETELEKVAVRTKAASIGDLIQLSRPETQRICAELGLSSSQTAYVQDMVEQKLTAVHERTESLKAQQHKEKHNGAGQTEGAGLRSVDRLFGGAQQQVQPFARQGPAAAARFDAKPFIKAYGETLNGVLPEQIKKIAPALDSPLNTSHQLDDALTVDRVRLSISPEPGNWLEKHRRYSRYWDLEKRRAA